MDRELGAVLDAAHQEGYEIWEIRGVFRWGVIICPGCVAYHDIPAAPRSPRHHLRRMREFTTDHQPHLSPAKAPQQRRS